MNFEIMDFNSMLSPYKGLDDIIKSNEKSQKFGLLLTHEQALRLMETRVNVLKAVGRIELGQSVIAKIIKAFCSSPYITSECYVQTLHELIEIFYYYKNETMDHISDDELIKFMRESFDDVCHGSLELLSGNQLDKLADRLRNGFDREDKRGSMMSKLIRNSIVSADDLSEKHYFLSLIDQAVIKGMLSDSDAVRIKESCLALLAHMIKKYTLGESSSVRQEIGEKIMESALYTIGIYLKAADSPDDAVKLLMGTDIFELYRIGDDLLKEKIAGTKRFYKAVLNNKIETKNSTYTATVIDGISGFFGTYDRRFGAHEIHITADYPVMSDIWDFAGIEFIEAYLQAIYNENKFCNRFSPEIIHELLLGYDRDYDALVFNIYEQVLINALGCVLINGDVEKLSIGPSDNKRLQVLMVDRTRLQIEVLILNAYRKLTSRMPDLDRSGYIKNSLSIIISAIFSVAKINQLDRVFICSRGNGYTGKIHYSMGEKMGNEKYRLIADAIMDCRLMSDKIAMIKRDVTALSDLNDLLLDDRMNREEIRAVLRQLDEPEIAALARLHVYITAGDIISCQIESTLSECLLEYIEALDVGDREMIMEIIRVIELE